MKKLISWILHPIGCWRYTMDKERFLMFCAACIHKEIEDPVVWEVSNSDLLGFVSANGAGFNTTNKLSYHLAKIEPMLQSKDGIMCSKQHRKSGDVNVFTRYRM